MVGRVCDSAPPILGEFQHLPHTPPLWHEVGHPGEKVLMTK